MPNVVLLFAKGCEEKPGNYRVVSQTSVVGKLMGWILGDDIYIQLDKHGLIWDSPRGFVHGRSCFTNLIEVFEKVMQDARAR